MSPDRLQQNSLGTLVLDELEDNPQMKRSNETVILGMSFGGPKRPPLDQAELILL